MYTFFWNGPLSNWARTPYTLNDIHYPTTEHGMMWEKANLFDSTQCDAILAASSPKDVKALGRQVRNFDKDLWNKKSAELIYPHLLEKFKQNSEARKHILKTGQTILVEASPYDRIWGIGYREKNALSVDKKYWGENRLGNVLMLVRTYLQTKTLK